MINIKMQPTEVHKLSPTIAVIGVGGAGGNAVNNMITSNLEGCQFLVCNTDAQALRGSQAENKLQLGMNVTGGLGAGSKPEVGQAAAEESLEDILRYIDGANMAFITAGMGGGTGTGAAPVIAKACRQQGILTVGVVTKPFHFEGAHRMDQAERGIKEMQQYVDTLIVIPNQNLFRIANEKTTFAEAFKMADSVLQSGVRGVTDLMVRPGLVNLDFADIRTAMLQMGKAMMGTGESSGEKRAIEAAESAINNPLLDDVSMKGAHGVIINVTGGYDMTMFEVDEACNRIRDEVDPNANIIFGSTLDENMEGFMRVSIVATGIDREGAKSKIFTGGSNSGGFKPETKMVAPPVVERATAPVAAASVDAPKSAVNAISGREAIRGLTAPAPIETQARSIMQPKAASVVQEVQSAEKAVDTSFEMFEQGEFVIEGLGEPILPQNTAMRGITYRDSFIPPKPMEADQSIPENGIGSHISSFHGAHAEKGKQDEENESSATGGAGLRLTPPRVASTNPQKRAPSLFERITGTVQQHIDNFRDDGDMIQKTAVSAPAPAPKMAVNASPAQGMLNVSVPAGKPAVKIDDELDIPAFLRRQAN